jgi:AraC-like DNA-binding protein
LSCSQRGRKDLAATYVSDPDMELVEDAFLLGSSNQSDFSRAFKRWAGFSPNEVQLSVKKKVRGAAP